MTKLINISELTELLNLDQEKGKKIGNHTLRYWEKEFSQIKPKIIQKRRYYNEDQIRIIRIIRFFLKEKGLTLKGVKKVLKSNLKQLDDYKSYGLKTDYYKQNIEARTKAVLKKLNKLKKHGKKNSY